MFFSPSREKFSEVKMQRLKSGKVMDADWIGSLCHQFSVPTEAGENKCSFTWPQHRGMTQDPSHFSPTPHLLWGCNLRWTYVDIPSHKWLRSCIFLQGSHPSGKWWGYTGPRGDMYPCTWHHLETCGTPVIEQQHPLNCLLLKKWERLYIRSLKHSDGLICFLLSSNGNLKWLQGWSFRLWRWKVASAGAMESNIFFKKIPWAFLFLNKKPWHSGGELLGFTWEQEQICMP